MRSVCSSNGLETSSIIVDFGSDSIKAGFSHHSFPQTIFRSRVGTPKYHRFSIFGELEGTHGLSEANILEPVMNFQKPIVNGEVKNWDNLEKIVYQIYFKELRVNPEDHPLVMNKPPYLSKSTFFRMIQLLLETFNVPSVNFVPAVPCILAAEGKTTGVVMECGDDLSFSGAVLDGYEIKNSIFRTPFGGNNVTHVLAEKMLLKRKSFSKSSEFHIVRSIKEQFGHVALDYLKEKSTEAETIDYLLPDGNIVKVDKEPWEAAETLFIPALANVDAMGVIDLLEETFYNSQIIIRKTLFTNIIVSGGSSQFTGFSQKVQNELSRTLPSQLYPQVNQASFPMFSFWRGAAVKTSMPGFNETCCTQADYNDGIAASEIALYDHKAWMF